MEVNFGANQTPVEQTAAPAQSQPQPQVPARIESSTPATNSMLLGDTLPKFTDVILPRLNIVQNIGALKDSFDPGSIVYAQNVELFIPQVLNAKTGVLERPATAPVILTVLGFKPVRYCEKVAGGVRGVTVNTEQEVRAAGGTLSWAEWNLKKESGMKRFEELHDALVLIERPEICKPQSGEDPTFNYEVEGKFYTIAFWAFRGTSFTDGCKRVLFPARLTGCLRKDWFAWSWAVSTRENTYPNGNKAWVPVFLPNKAATPALTAFARDVITAKPKAADPADDSAQ